MKCRQHMAAGAKPAATEPSKTVELWSLPPLSTAEQIGDALQCSSRTILNWSKGPTPKIPVAFQVGKVIRFDPRQVALALGIPAPAGAAAVDANG